MFPNENINCDPSLELSYQDSSNERSQHYVLLEKYKNHLSSFQNGTLSGSPSLAVKNVPILHSSQLLILHFLVVV